MAERNATLVTRAKAMRREMPEPERRLWAVLRAWRLDGAKFSRQVPIGRYIADFAARRERLIVEVDGDTHGGREAADAARTRALEALGYRVVRVTNRDVMTNIEGVALHILDALRRREAPSPQPSPRGGEGVHDDLRS